MRAAVDWPRLNGQVGTVHVDVPGLSLALPVRIVVKPPTMGSGAEVQCGLPSAGCGVRDWMYREGALVPVWRAVRFGPASVVSRARVLEGVRLVVADRAESPLVAPAKPWPEELEAREEGEAMDWRRAADALSGCRATIGVPLQPYMGLASSVCSAPFVLERVFYREGLLEVRGCTGESVRMEVDPPRARLFGRGAFAHLLFDAYGRAAYAGLSVRPAA